MKPGYWAYHQGAFRPFEKVGLPLSTQALHYGTGVFEGIRAYPAVGGELALFRSDDHYRRLLEGCRLLRIDLEVSERELTGITLELLHRNGHHAGAYVRPLAYKLGLLPHTRPGVTLSGVSAALSIISYEAGPDAPASGLRCVVSSWRRPSSGSVPAGVKVTGGYLIGALATDEARSTGYDTAILLDEAGRVAEAVTANVFTVRDGRVRTPPKTAGILPGITRDTVLALAGDLALDAGEEHLDLADLLTADEVFLTSTAGGVSPVVEVSGRAIGDGRPGTMTAVLAAAYGEAVDGTRHREWLTAGPATAA